jgi:hypothetical protein
MLVTMMAKILILGAVFLEAHISVETNIQNMAITAFYNSQDFGRAVGG